MDVRPQGHLPPYCRRIPDAQGGCPQACPRQGNALTGVGISVRPAHIAQLVAQAPDIDCIELLADNLLFADGIPTHIRVLADRYPTSLHCVGLSVGSPAGPNHDYLTQLTTLADQLDVETISDHLCWTRIHGRHLHELLPLPRTMAAVRRVVGHVRTIQDRLRRPLSLENASAYMDWAASEMSEAEFMRAVVEHADCGILLDVNNVFVSSENLDFDARAYIQALPSARITSIHLAGHQDMGDYLLDSHDAPVAPPVWALYEHAIRVHGHAPTIIEWDGQIPPLTRLLDEVRSARAICQSLAQ